jgi:hypothetical protein
MVRLSERVGYVGNSRRELLEERRRGWLAPRLGAPFGG